MPVTPEDFRKWAAKTRENAEFERQRQRYIKPNADFYANQGDRSKRADAVESEWYYAVSVAYKAILRASVDAEKVLEGLAKYLEAKADNERS